jgi:hypothetical protein
MTLVAFFPEVQAVRVGVLDGVMVDDLITDLASVVVVAPEAARFTRSETQ